MMPTLSRRQVLVHLGAAAVSTGAANAIPEQTQDHIRGKVVQKGDAGLQNLAGVMVSNGFDVVLSDHEGAWALPARQGHDIFVIKPPHMRLVTGAGQAPRLAADARAIPCGAGTIFTLEPSPEPDQYDVILLTDTQPDSEEELGFVRDDILSSVIERPAAFGIHHGDVVSDALHLYPRYQQLLQATGLTWHHCIGNHDLDRDGGIQNASRSTWRCTFGPRWYAFQYAQAVFFILDNVDDLGNGRYEGRFGPEQLAFVRRVLAHVPADRLVVLSMHIPLRSYLAPNDPADVTADYEELLTLLSDRPHAVSFSGHLHATEHHYLQVPNAASGLPSHHHHVLTAASGSWWSGPRDARGIPCADSTDGSPNGFHVMRVRGTAYQTEFVPAVRKGLPHLRAELQTVPKDGSRELIVNVFDGGPRTRVFHQARAGEWLPMCPRADRDPLICRMLQGGAPRKSWVDATPSSHIWTARIDDGASETPLRIDIRVIDEYGRRTETRLLLEQRSV